MQIKNTPNYLFLFILFGFSSINVNAQIKINAPYFVTSLGAQDYPTNRYALFDIDHESYRDFVVVRTSKFRYFKGTKGGYNNTLTIADDLFTNGAADNSVKNNNMVFMDVDNNGDSNLVFRNAVTNDINKAVYNTATSKYDVTQIIANSNLSGLYITMLSADMDGDGREDLVTVGTSSSGGVYLYKQQANGSFSKLTVRAAAIQNSGFVIDDIDNDNDNDIIVLSQDGKMYLFKNNGTGSFTETTPITNLKTGRTFAANYSNLSIGDVNNDGRKDLVISSYSGVWVSLYKANSNGTYTETVLRANNAALAGGVNTHITDIDGDGDMDIVAGRPTNPNGLSYFENIGNTSFSSEKVLTNHNTSDLFTSGLADDFDRDGQIDYINSYNSYMTLFRSSQNHYTALTTASIINTFIAGPGTDAVSVVISNPFAGKIKFNAANNALTDVTITDNNTPTVTITGLGANVQIGLKSLTYTGVLRGDQYFDIDISSGGRTHSMRVGVTITNTAFTVLPLNLLSINATKKEQHIAVNWQTSGEVNTTWFEIERSADGRAFTQKGTLPAFNNPSVTNNYIWNDVSPLSGINYYRLRSVDRDGAFSYSKIVMVNFTVPEAGMQAYPVPASTEVQITIPPSGTAQMLTIFDNNGRMRDQIKVAKNVTSVTLPISSYPSGVFIIRTQNGQKTKFIKQ